MLKDLSFEDRFLNSNYNVLFYYDGMQFHSIEAAYQASKTNDLVLRCKLSKMTPKGASYRGRQILPDDSWYNNELQILKTILLSAFKTQPMKQKLLSATSFVGHNMVHDNLYGVCDCPKCKTLVKYNCYGRLLNQLQTALKNLN